MTKCRSTPSALPSRRRMRTPMAWKVPIQTAPAVRFRRFSTRLRISRAALLVNVTARISPGSARPCWISQAIRCVSTRVLPLPAPAKISNGPSSAVTAARCGGFSPAKRSVARSAAGEEDRVNTEASLVSAAAAAHPTGGHIVRVVVYVRFVPPLRPLERLGEGADELVAQLHGRDLERVFQRPVILFGVFALGRPEQELDQLDLDGRHQLGGFLGPPFLALPFGAGRVRRWGTRAVTRAHAPSRTGRGGTDGRGLGHQAGAQCRQVVLRRRGLGGLLSRRRRWSWHRGRWLVGRRGLPFLGYGQWRHRKARRRRLTSRLRGCDRLAGEDLGRHHLRWHRVLRPRLRRPLLGLLRRIVL